MKIKRGDKVKIGYTITDKYNIKNTYYSSKEPEEYVIGAAQISQSIEDELIGLEKGNSKIFELDYIKYNPDLKVNLKKSLLPEDYFFRIGEYLSFKGENDSTHGGIVVDILSEEVVLDLNPLMAGKKVVYNVKIVDVTEGSIEDTKINLE